MSNPTQASIGVVAAIWRYPVKSMMGEELNATEITQGGLLGDRAYALVDQSDEKTATAKNPKKWPTLFDFRANLIDPPRRSSNLRPVRLTLPDGTIATSSQRDLNRLLSRVLNREVTLRAIDSTTLRRAQAEEYWPDMEGLDHRDTLTDFALPVGTFFDCATVHLLTTATVDHLRELYPEGRFEVRRFRPNIVVQSTPGDKSFAESAWIGRTVAVGDEVRLRITGPCSRCVMTTLSQGDLPPDPGILRTAARHNKANVGVYAEVSHTGLVRRGDAVRIE
jgi:uncharacterized protein YcbX